MNWRAPGQPSRFTAALLGVTCFALLLRLLHLYTAVVPVEIAGDGNDYVHYALNLQTHGIYSNLAPAPGLVPPSDSFRPPGYALLLLAAMKLTPTGHDWIQVLYLIQSALGAATVWLTGRIGRHWLPAWAAIGAALLLCLWPHQITFARTLLSEVLAGFCLALALLLTLHARKQPALSAIWAGLAFATAAMVNTVLFAPAAVAALWLLWRSRGHSLVFTAALLALPLAWGLWQPSQDEAGPGRLSMNLVQGSWPQHHAAWRTSETNEISRRILSEMDAEIAEVSKSPSAGVARILSRTLQDPAYYAHWYLIEKPIFLWDWDIAVGYGGYYFIPADRAAIDQYPALRISTALVKSLNPLLVFLAYAAVAFAILKARRVPADTLLVVGMFVILTLVHVALQAEPRYAIPYRPLQLLLAATAVFHGVELLRRASRVFTAGSQT